jgi:membrane fusion protein (multidrug efflux system)
MRSLFIICLALPLLASCDDESKKTAAPAPKPAVGVRAVAMQSVNQSFEFVGHVKATDKVDIRARVEGFIEAVGFREGQYVQAGDLLYKFERVQFQAQLDNANANLAAAEAETTNAQLQYARHLELAKNHDSPQSVVDQDKANLDSAKAKVLQAHAAVTQAAVTLGYTEIRSPIEGRIGRTALTIGNLVNPASGVLTTIVSQDPMYVLFPISVRDLDIIRELRRATGGDLSKTVIRIHLANGQEYAEDGLWNLTDPIVDQQTDTLIVRAIIPNHDGILVDGQFVTVSIREREGEQRLVVPQSAVQLDQSGNYVLVVDDQHKVAQRRIQTGVNRGIDVVVATGLQAGEKVIVDGIQKVRPGQEVTETVQPAPQGGK